MKRLVLLLVLAFACKPSEAPPATETTDTREAIAVSYVGSPELVVHAKADDASPVLTKYLNGESVSVLSRKGDWVEIRTTTGSGWAHGNELTDAATAKKEEDNPTPKFRKAPSPISAPGAHGTVYIEAQVNNDGDVTSTKVLTNTTGMGDLGARNEAALMTAKFYPIVQKGQKKSFVYYYRVDY